MKKEIRKKQGGIRSPNALDGIPGSKRNRGRGVPKAPVGFGMLAFGSVRFGSVRLAFGEALFILLFYFIISFIYLFFSLFYFLQFVLTSVRSCETFSSLRNFVLKFSKFRIKSFIWYSYSVD